MGVFQLYITGKDHYSKRKYYLFNDSTNYFSVDAVSLLHESKTHVAINDAT